VHQDDEKREREAQTNQPTKTRNPKGKLLLQSISAPSSSVVAEKRREEKRRER